MTGSHSPHPRWEIPVQTLVRTLRTLVTSVITGASTGSASRY
jgi:hypothetical protein